MTPDAIITTSWDDGHPLDERLMEILNRHGIAATFYVPTHCDRAVMDAPAIRRLAGLGAEIGGHTTNHCLLTKLPEAAALAEMSDNRRHLEDQMGQAVSSFCYPCGHFSRRLMTLAQQAGFARARTTMGLRTDLGAHPFALPVTVQLYPHGRGVHLRHAVKEGNVRGIISWLSMGAPRTVADVVDEALTRITRSGGVLHLWGHSWELDECGLWPLLDEVLARIAHQPNVRYLTNAQAYAVSKTGD